MNVCVLREVAPGDFQYVPVTEVPALNPDDTIYVGEFRSQVENLGPSGSHRRTICLPVGKVQEFKPGRVVIVIDAAVGTFAGAEHADTPASRRLGRSVIAATGQPGDCRGCCPCAGQATDGGECPGAQR